MGVPLTCWGPIVPSVGALRERAAAVIVASCRVVLAGHIRVRLQPSCAIGAVLIEEWAVRSLDRHRDARYRVKVPGVRGVQVRRVISVGGSCGTGISETAHQKTTMAGLEYRQVRDPTSKL
ncbi:hypothetical protein NDU88_002329 [Pleurodeles waltl]|uniref:Uncharacterized protein n=1 Tax=Pleurodeles waltl TaxID=8319 RepID=A0AAV7W2J5_PLEWA|nr:hypothetical protein NDU88_002329 [Pleurodeles waltl]